MTFADMGGNGRSFDGPRQNTEAQQMIVPRAWLQQIFSGLLRVDKKFRDRQQLKRLSNDTLKDIGFTRSEIQRDAGWEVGKPFFMQQNFQKNRAAGWNHR